MENKNYDEIMKAVDTFKELLDESKQKLKFFDKLYEETYSLYRIISNGKHIKIIARGCFDSGGVELKIIKDPLDIIKKQFRKNISEIENIIKLNYFFLTKLR